MILLAAVPHSKAADLEPPVWNPADMVVKSLLPLHTSSFANGFVSLSADVHFGQLNEN